MFDCFEWFLKRKLYDIYIYNLTANQIGSIASLNCKPFYN